MSQFLIGVIVLIVGYFTYGKLVEKKFGADDAIETPAIRLEDGIDFSPMSWPRIFLIQLLNIAGLGPIFGAIQGALFGPAAFVWIALGSIFAGAVHDYFSGMMSLRHDGLSIAEIVGIYLGEGIRKVMRVFSVVLLVLVGTVFMSGPAGLIANLAPFGITSITIWSAVVLVYYFIATILPVDKVIGKIYPLFGLSLLIMAVGVGGMMLFGDYSLPGFTVRSMHPDGIPIWAVLFTTIACGAISGFHATQSPMMARCLEKESDGRKIFYGAMIVEGIIAMIWAAAGMAFFGGIPQLQTAFAEMGAAAGVVNHISLSLLGPVGGVLAMLGVIAAPITSGDTAFRSARLTIADAAGYDQGPVKNRLILSAPLFIIAIVLSQVDFNIIWKYFTWTNQVLAMMILWAATGFLIREGKTHMMTTLPAIFMTAVVSTYILQAKEGFQLATNIAYPLGLVIAAALSIFFLKQAGKNKGKQA